eukprot:NODE_8673_length_399_cov_31.557143_g7790_i0.p1 GENE.NODE_8673_length_399_cov_31.557143_g7790_i0~~NODE_8673_length_399_cov_31.557143_g7790_i0.p1  ORF type:complete len:108 (+),score=33.26 NODE_8673_length_399_cov_31.557143_g7790_i0:23-325(+)
MGAFRLLNEPPERVQKLALEKSEGVTYDWGLDAANRPTFSTVVERILSTKGIVCDKRPPDVIRAAPVAMYTRFEDVWMFVTTLKQTLDYIRSLESGGARL